MELPPKAKFTRLEKINSLSEATDIHQVNKVVGEFILEIAIRYDKIRKKEAKYKEKKASIRIAPNPVGDLKNLQLVNASTQKVKIPPNYSSLGTLKRYVYAVGVALKHANQVGVVSNFIPEERIIRQNTPDPRTEVFFWLTTAIIAKSKEGLPSSQIWKLSKQLEYAFRHKVPPELVVGFIYLIVNPEDISKKIETGEKESWYTE